MVNTPAPHLTPPLHLRPQVVFRILLQPGVTHLQPGVSDLQLGLAVNSSNPDIEAATAHIQPSGPHCCLVQLLVSLGDV